MDGLDRQRQRNARRWRERIARFRTQGAVSLGLCLLAALAAGALVLALAAALGAGPGDGGGTGASGSGGGGAIISSESTVTIGLVMAVVGSVISMTVWITTKINGLSRKIDSSMERVAAVERTYLRIDLAAENALRQAIANPGHRVPDPRNPGELIVVHREDEGERDGA